jgi:hypothetical protein
MNLQTLRNLFISVAVVAGAAAPSFAQKSAKTPSSAASRAAAEMTQGRLTPADSQPGDVIAVRLKEDVKANGSLVLKKGTSITGIVLGVKRGAESADMQSMIEIEWLPPVAEGKVPQTLSIALQSLTQDDEVQRVHHEIKRDFAKASSPAPSVGRTNPALLSMPFVMEADPHTSSIIQNSATRTSSGPLFKVGRGQLASAGGRRQSIEIFTHLNNDTVITSESKDFEIYAGAQMQLLIGVNRK